MIWLDTYVIMCDIMLSPALHRTLDVVASHVSGNNYCDGLYKYM